MHPTKKLKGSKSKLLYGKKIVVAVSSSIAAIETPRLMRELIRHGAEVYCIATEETKKIIGECSLEFGCGNKVFYNITGSIEHVMLYDICDAMVIYPATANTISKISLNIADNIVNTTSTMFFEKKPIFIVPAMHQNMLDTISNHLTNLKNKKNVYIVSPKMEEEKAKVPSIEEVVLEVIKKLNGNEKKNKDGNNNYKNTYKNTNKKVLILSGGTTEFIDKVRVISNLSSGKTGYLLAEAFCRDGFDVEVIYGSGIEPPYYIKSHKVLTAKEMLNNALKYGKDADIIISCAAISDFIPEKQIEGKIKSDKDIVIKLKRNPKVLSELRKAFPNKIIVGFKAEYGLNKDELLNISTKKLKEYNLDYIVANDLSKHYFGDDSNEVILIGKNTLKEFKGKKSEIVEKIKDELVNNL
ncbi:bifunctional phosphopantothenoylcysteine decarboxylase/phosphopantothenate--cysteine ligase CoaBC [Methanothermococcus okinawensis]|uniref:Coenzyme A biosynthesis bifunctional protein CoaBC n=1 Tax=Methanothermococcus okinawensis (strain DSM 14208 / JCM 11175 / IH1) TaxID=647113 RepID=F8AN51_METOI|nr:bifunctional phosphopantothenoylcysteine decarboxylase/phosphopantothenate--cysteine ligase CoaBC [Methanothermococcus okinawensis]AEH06965.1 phosphopantothenoylcysteine decarboxylase/phosphopantothenate/cysteine ligase [Methanothermococcus okinawensis IH1]